MTEGVEPAQRVGATDGGRPGLMLDTPVALFIYNRPAHTRRVFQAIAAARPRRLLIVAEGPNPGRPDDPKRCAAAQAETEAVDWECEVSRDVAAEDVGCYRRLTSGLNWVFEQTPEAIVLEDDCVPDPTFFRYCEELLQRYRDDSDVMVISGHSLPGGLPGTPTSYDFARMCVTWGWASWRRAWAQRPAPIGVHQAREERLLERILRPNGLAEHWYQAFEYSREWDIEWLFARLLAGGLAVVPATNLVSNIGFGSDSTHTTETGSALDAMPSQPMRFPLRHPQHRLPNPRIDEMLARMHFREPTLRAHAEDFLRHRTTQLRRRLRRMRAR